MRRVLMAVLMSFGLLAGCESEPVYRGVSFIAYNYTQYEMDRVTLSDEEGGRATSMQVSVGAVRGRFRAAIRSVVRNSRRNGERSTPWIFIGLAKTLTASFSHVRRA